MLESACLFASGSPIWPTLFLSLGLFEAVQQMMIVMISKGHKNHDNEYDSNHDNINDVKQKQQQQLTQQKPLTQQQQQQQ